MPATSLDQIISLCKRRGFIFPGSEIYGGLQGTYDYGPLGVELKNNLKRLWWKHNVYERDDMEGIETALLTNRYVLRYSGHEKGFTDPLIDNKLTKKRYRFDHLLKEQTTETLDAIAASFGITRNPDMDIFVDVLLGERFATHVWRARQDGRIEFVGRGDFDDGIAFDPERAVFVHRLDQEPPREG